MYVYMYIYIYNFNRQYISQVLIYIIEKLKFFAHIKYTHTIIGIA